MVVFRGDKCHYSHVKTPPAKPKDSNADSKAKPKRATPTVAAAVAIVAAPSSIVTPSQAIGGLEWAADTGAGRHLVSYEALQEQGYYRSVFSAFTNDSHEKLNFSTGGGFKKSSHTIGFKDQDGILSDANHFLLDFCPMVKSIGFDVEQSGSGFIWLPGSLPFLVRDPSKCHLSCDEENKFFASRVTQNAPFFKNNFTVTPGKPAELFHGSSAIDVLPPLDPAAELVEVPEVLSVEPAIEPSVDPGMPSDPASVEHDILAPPPFDHKLTDFPKLSTCDVCNRARLYSKSVKSRRVVNEELDLAELEAFGQQLACDHLIVFKSSRGKEHAVLIVQDRFSQVLQAYPTISREASQLALNLKHFVGLKSNSYTIVRSDPAGEILKAVIETNWLPESSVPSRFLHNSVLEREMRSQVIVFASRFCCQTPALASSIFLGCNCHVCILER